MTLKGILIFLVAAFVALFTSNAVMAANPLETVCHGPVGNGKAAGSPTCQQNSKQSGTVNPLVNTIHEAANFIATVAGIVAVFMVVYGGLRYIISGNDPEGQKHARSILEGAIIGLIIIALAWTIVTLVTNVLV
jgi:hypothetical protein